MTPAPGTRSKSPAVSGLSRETVASKALELADRDGLEGLTMRRLAAELGVGTMTLYGYFRSKDELIDAATDFAAEQIALPERRGDWREQLRALVAEVHRVLRAHPSAAQIRARAPILSTGALRATNHAMAILGDAGFGKADAAAAWRLLFVYMFGSVAFTPESVPEESAREWRSRIGALPPDEFDPLLSALPEAIATMTGSEQFHAGLDVILDGLEARLARRSTAGDGPAG
jgi:AcrR family transcriptional regulator